MDKRESKTPHIRFPEFSDRWEHKQLSELLQVSKKKNKDLKYSKEEVLSVSGEEGIVNQIEHMGRSYAGASVHNYGIVEKGDIVYTKSPLKANPYGIIKMNKGLPGIVSTLYAIYKVNEQEADGQFIEHYFSLDANTNRYLRPLVRKGAKNDMKINNEYVLHDRIYAPQKNEQIKISKLFNLFDKKIMQLKKRNLQLEDYKSGVIQKLSKSKKLKEIEFGEIAELRKEKFNPKNNAENRKCIELEHLDQGTGRLLGYISSENQKSQKNTFYKGDILFGKLRPYLNKYWNCNFDGVCSGEIWVLKPKTNIVLSNYLYIIIQTQQFFRPVRISSGSKMPRADWGIVSSSIVSILEDENEQQKVANFINSIEDKIRIVNRQIEEYTVFKKSLLQQMLCY